MNDKLRAYFWLQPTAHLLNDPEQNHLVWLSYIFALENMDTILQTVAPLKGIF